MTENKHGFTPKTEFTMGGIAWTIIQTGESWVKCIASECVEERAFDEKNKNDFAASSLRAYLNGEFLQKLTDAGAPEAMFKEFVSDLTADDGLKQYGTDSARIGLITCDEYRALRENIPPLPNDWWWTATPDSPINNFVRYVNTGGALDYYYACNGSGGVRPLCVLQSEILKSYLDGDRQNGEMRLVLHAGNGRAFTKLGSRRRGFLQSALRTRNRQVGSKGARRSNRGGGYPIVLLIPARTDTSYFHDHIYGKAEIRFVRGRLRFTDEEGNAADPAPFPSMVVIYNAERVKSG